MQIQSNELMSFINDLDELEAKTYLFEVLNVLFMSDQRAIEDFKIRWQEKMKHAQLKEHYKNSNVIFPEF